MNAISHRLEGLESDNALAFLALLGLLRALEAADHEVGGDRAVRPRAGWDTARPPLRPRLRLARHLDINEVVEHAERGIEALASAYDFDGEKDLNTLARSAARC